MNPIVQLAASALPGERKYVLFAGAGLSKDAGVPTAWDLMMETAKLLYCADGCTGNPSRDELEKWFLSSAYASMTYADLIGTLYPTPAEQQAFLSKFLNGYKAGEAHGLVAELVRRGIIRAIVTTNFDGFIEQCLEQLQLAVQVISNDDDLQHSEPLIHCKAIRIYKPHGTLGRGALRNTPEDLKQLSTEMEDELIRILGEHGVLILGYSGSDLGILTVLSKRKSNRYPLFWADPSKPKGEALRLIESNQYQFIPCTGAARFLKEYLQLVDRLGELSPPVSRGPTLFDLEQSLKSGGPQVSAVWNAFASAITQEVKATAPDFSKFTNYDDAIVDQINRGTPTSVRFAEAAILAASYENLAAAKSLYRNFGTLAVCAELPEDFSGSYHETDHDGFKFLNYEMLVTLVASLIRYERWVLLENLLSERIFIARKRKSEYVSLSHFRPLLRSLDEWRNNRLKLTKVSVTAQMIKDRFTTGRPGKVIDFREFYDADYLLYLYTVLRETNEYLMDTWVPWSTLYDAEYVPVFIAKAESRRFLELFQLVCGVEDMDEFKKLLSERLKLYRKFFRERNAYSFSGFHFDAAKFGSIP